MFKALGVAVLSLSMFLVGCNANHEFAVRQGAEIATVVALVETEATVDEAKQLKSIAINLKAVVNNDGNIDPELIKSFIIAQLADQFNDPADRVIYTLLASKVFDLVMAQLDKKPLGVIQEDDVKILVLAAADGIESGSDIYILSFGPEVRALEAKIAEPEKPLE